MLEGRASKAEGTASAKVPSSSTLEDQEAGQGGWRGLGGGVEIAKEEDLGRGSEESGLWLKE